MKANFIFEGKSILTLTDDITNLPRKHTNIIIEDKVYTIKDFSLGDNSVLYIVEMN